MGYLLSSFFRVQGVVPQSDGGHPSAYAPAVRALLVFAWVPATFPALAWTDVPLDRFQPDSLPDSFAKGLTLASL